jgi:hypothetical protein
MGLRSWWAAIQERRAGRRVEIQCDDAGVAFVVRGKPPLRMAWEHVDAVYAYKRDCYTVDQIRLILRSNDQSSIEVTESDEGYQALIAEMERRLPGFPMFHEWWDKVAFPAFETNWTEIYRRPWA